MPCKEMCNCFDCGHYAVTDDDDIICLLDNIKGTYPPEADRRARKIAKMYAEAWRRAEEEEESA